MNTLYSFIKKSSLIFSRCKLLFISTLIIISLCFAGSVFAATITVNCTGKQTDRALIQKYINKAAPGETINLVGTCQLDGIELFVNTSNLTIQGAGAAGKWSTVLKGVTISNSPAGDNTSYPFTYFNRGIAIGAEDASVSVANVNITGIKFEALNHGIDVDPQLGGNTSLCPGIDGSVLTNNTASYIVLTNNWFDNTYTDILGFGASDHVTVQNNLFTDSHGGFTDIGFFGQAEGCQLSDGSYSRFFVGTPTYVSIIGNTNQNDQQSLYSATLWFYGVNNATVANNNFINTSGGLVVDMAGSNNLVSGNIMDGGGVNAASGGGPAVGFYVNVLSGGTPEYSVQSVNNLVINNQIRNSLPGIMVQTATPGWSFIANHITGTVYGDPAAGDPNVGDVLFCDDGSSNTFFCESDPGNPSFNNVVITPYCLHVFNLGKNNILLGLINVSTNPNVPPSGACSLQQ